MRFEAGSLPLHAALFVREACVGPVADGDSPPPLLTTPPLAPVRVDQDDWRAWWSTLADSGHWSPRAGLWPSAPAVLAESLEHLGDDPFRWVSQHVRDADRYREPVHSLPVQEVVSEFGRRSLMDVRIEGLAVRGDWVEVSGNGSVVLASWAALDHARDWLADSLRPAFRRA